MVTKKRFILTAVYLHLLIFLAACGGGVSEEAETAPGEGIEASETIVEGQEATGSESSGGGLLPTPDTGLKVQPTRVASSIHVDLYFLIQTPFPQTIDLDALPNWLVVQSVPIEARVGLGFLDANGMARETLPLTTDLDSLTAVLPDPANENRQAPILATALDETLPAVDWGVGSDRLLFIFISNEFADEEMMVAVAETAAANNVAIYPFLFGDQSPAEQLRWQELSLATNGQLTSISDLPIDVEDWEQIITEALNHSLEN